MFKSNAKLGCLPVQVEAESLKELFQQLSFFAEAPQKCGHCGKPTIVPRHREYDGNDFYELICTDCHHTFNFSQAKKGGHLFTRREREWNPPHQKQGNE